MKATLACTEVRLRSRPRRPPTVAVSSPFNLFDIKLKSTFGHCPIHVGHYQCLLLQAQRWISPWLLLKRPSNLPQMTFSAISWATMGERYCLDCTTLLCSGTFGFLIPACMSPAAGWRSSGRCWQVVVQECAKLSLPHPWRCSRSSCRMLADLVIITIIQNTWGFLPLEITTHSLC